MNRNMLDILACPIDKHHPLELYSCDDGPADDITEGVLYCGNCSRFFIITEGIPVMMPDDLRDPNMEREFLERNRDKIPDKIKHGG